MEVPLLLPSQSSTLYILSWLAGTANLALFAAEVYGHFIVVVSLSRQHSAFIIEQDLFSSLSRCII